MLNFIKEIYSAPEDIYDALLLMDLLALHLLVLYILVRRILLNLGWDDESSEDFT